MSTTVEGQASGSALLRAIRSSNFVKRGKVREDRVAAAKFSDLVDFAQKLADISAIDSALAERSHTFSASLGLAGGPEECEAIRCRLGRLDQLSRFAALLGDRVFIRNYFAPWRDHPELFPDEALNRQLFANNLKTFLAATEVIQSGLLVPFTPPPKFCPGCLANARYGPNAAKRLSTATRNLFKRFRSESTLWFEYSPDYFSIRCDTPEDLLEHGFVLTAEHPPAELSIKHPRVLARIMNGEPLKLSAKLRKEFPFDRDLASRVLQSIHFQLATSQLLASSLVTDRPIHAEFLSKLARDRDLEQVNHVAGQHLTAALPFIANVPMNKLVRLRTSEPHSFEMFRAAILKAAQTVQGSARSFSASHAKQLYADVVAPELARLDRIVSTTRREALSSSVRSSAAIVFALSFGLYLGIIPSEAAEAAKVLGAGKALIDITTRASDALAPSRSIQKEEFYFLWRLKRFSK